MTDAVIGLDIGTSSVKAVAVSKSGGIIGRASSSSLSLRGGEPGWAIQDPADLIDATFEALAGVMGDADDSTRFVALSIAAQSGSVVGLDSNGIPVTDLITWMDTRAADMVDRWDADGTADRIRELSGWQAGCGLGLSTIAWLTRTGEIDRQGIDRFASADDLIVHALTGQWRTNPSNAAGMQLMDLTSAKWSDELCALAGIDASMLSELVPTGTVFGPLTQAARERLHTAAAPAADGLLVVAGGHDQSCAALALGITEPGECLLATGTAWVLTTVTSVAGADDLPRSMSISRHVFPGRFTASQYLGGFGASMQWWAKRCAESEGAKVTFETLDREVAADRSARPRPTFTPTGSNGSELAAPGAGVFVGAEQATQRSQQTRAVMDAGAHAASTTLGTLDEVTSLTMIGGATGGISWPRIVASAAELPITVVADESLPGLGAAAIAATSVAMFPDTGSALAAVDVDSLIVLPGTECQA